MTVAPGPIITKASGGVMAEGKEASCERGPASQGDCSAKGADRRNKEINMTKTLSEGELVAEMVAALRHALKLLEPFDDPELSLGLGSNALAPIRAAIAKAEASRLTPSAIGAEIARPLSEWNFDIGSAPVDEPILAAIEFHSSGQPETERFVCRINSHGEMVTERGESIGWDFTDVAYAWMPLPNAAPPTAQEG